MSTKTDASPPSSELESDVDTYLPHVDDQFIPRAAPPRTRQMSVRSAAGLSDLLSQSRRQSEASTVDNLVNLDHLGGPGKCGHLYLKYWSDKKLDPRKHVPDVDVKYKVYRSKERFLLHRFRPDVGLVGPFVGTGGREGREFQRTFLAQGGIDEHDPGQRCP